MNILQRSMASQGILNDTQGTLADYLMSCLLYTSFNKEPLSQNVEEMFIGPFGSSLKNENFVSKENGYCMVSVSYTHLSRKGELFAFYRKHKESSPVRGSWMRTK